MRTLTYCILISCLILGLGACQQKGEQDVFFQPFFDRTQDELDQNIVYDIARTKDIVYEKRQLNLLYQSMEKVYDQSKIILHKIEGIRNNLNRESDYKNQITKDLDSLLFFGRHLLLDELKELVQEAEETKIRGVKFDPADIDQLQRDLVLINRTLKNYKLLRLEKASKEEIRLVLECFEQETIMSAAQIINFIRANIGGRFPRWKMYYPIALSPKPPVSFGEIYEADIFLGSFRSQEDFSLKVNGKT